MASLAMPRMNKPWKVVCTAMALFGFVYGYVGSAGAPFCGSMGSCLKLAADRGLSGFAAASLIPGAISAAIFAAVVYALFLAVFAARKVLRRDAISGESNQSSRPALALRKVPKHWCPPTPSSLAIRRLALALALATGVYVGLSGLEIWPSVPASTPTYACTHNLAQPEWDYVLDEATQLCEPTPFIVAEVRRQYGQDPVRHIKPNQVFDMFAHPAVEGGWSYNPEYLVRAAVAAVVVFVGLAALRLAWRSLR